METTLHIKTNKVLKAKAEKFAANSGLTLTTLVNLSLRQTLSAGQLVIQESYAPNAATAKELRQSLRDAATGKNLSPSFSSSKEMDAYLLKQAKQ